MLIAVNFLSAEPCRRNRECMQCDYASFTVPMTAILPAAADPGTTMSPTGSVPVRGAWRWPGDGQPVSDPAARRELHRRICELQGDRGRLDKGPTMAKP